MNATAIRGNAALVTGAAGGIGAFIARTLARHGANLVLTGRNEAALKDLQLELEASGVHVDVLVADLADREAHASVIEMRANDQRANDKEAAATLNRKTR
jgi:uncharacterized protein